MLITEDTRKAKENYVYYKVDPNWMDSVLRE